MAKRQPTANSGREHQLAVAYSRLENAIGDIYGAIAQLEIIADGTIFSEEGVVEKRAKDAVNVPDFYHLSIWTDKQNTALLHTLHQIIVLGNELHRDYYAGFEGAQP